MPASSSLSHPVSPKRMRVFSGRSNPELAEGICRELGTSLGAVTLKTFSNGEVYCRYEESIRDTDVFLIQPTSANNATRMSTNDSLMELMVMIDAAVSASAHRVVAVMPWYAYSRQDKLSLPREPISARMVARMLESAGIHRLLTTDLHAGQLQGLFQVPVDHTTALKVLTRYFADLPYPATELVVVAPDAGRVKLNKCFARCLGADLAILDKERPRHQAAKIGHIIGDVAGKTAIIVDDMIDTAGTLTAAAEMVVRAGAARVHAAATHGLFTGAAFANLASAPIERIVVTDTVAQRSDALPNLEVLSTAPLLAKSIAQVFAGGSVSEVFGFGRELQLF